MHDACPRAPVGNFLYFVYTNLPVFLSQLCWYGLQRGAATANDRHSTCGWRELLDQWLTGRTTTIRAILTPAVQSTTRQLLDRSHLVAETLSRLRRWGINTWADLLTPEERLTTELPYVLPEDLQLPPDMIIEPPHLRQGQFWYKTADPAGSPMALK